MNASNEQSELRERSAVYSDKQDGEQSHGARTASSTSGQMGATEQMQSGRRRTRFGMTLFKPFKLAGSGIKKAVQCCFQCSTSESDNMVPRVEIVEDRNQEIPSNAHEKPHFSPVEHEVGKNEGCEDDKHEQILETPECRPSADVGPVMQSGSRSSSGEEEKVDHEALCEQDGDAREVEGAPVVVKEAYLAVISAAEGGGQPSSTAPSDVALSSNGQSSDNEVTMPNALEAKFQTRSEGSSEHESKQLSDFRGALVEEEAAMTSENDDLDTEEDSEVQSRADNERTFQDDSYLQFFVNENIKSCDSSENGSVGNATASASDGDETSDRTTEHKSDNSVTETEDESPSMSTSYRRSFGSDQVQEYVENGDEEEGTCSREDFEGSETDGIGAVNGDGIISHSSTDPMSRDGSPSGETSKEGSDHNDSNGNENEHGNSVFGFVLSKLRSVLTSFRRENSEAEEPISEDSRAQYDSDNDDETLSNDAGSESEAETLSSSRSSSHLSASAAGSSSQSDTCSVDAHKSADNEEGLGGKDSDVGIREAATSQKSAEDDRSEAQSLPVIDSSSSQSLNDSDHSSRVMSSPAAESFKDSDHSSQVMTSSSAGSFESSIHSSERSPASAESPVDSDFSSQVVTSSSADMQTDSDEMEFGEESGSE